MKSLRSIKHKKKLPIIPVIATLAALLLLGVGIWYFFFNKPTTTTPPNPDGVNAINYDPPTEEEKQAASEQKDQIIKQQDPPATDTTLSVTISRTFQEAGAFKLRTFVDGTSSGECIATFTKAGQPTVVKTFAVVFEATTASCQDASVPVSEFGASGDWELSLIVKKDNKQSAAATASVTITK